MTDLSGITVTPGVLDPQRKDALGQALDRIGGKMIDSVRIDTTHFVCTEGRGPLWEKAVEMNIPVVVPEWVDACESEGTIVGVRGYYLNADPKTRQLSTLHGSSHQRTTSTMSVSTAANQGRPSEQPQSPPQQQENTTEPPLTPFPGAELSSQPQAQAQEVSSEDEEDVAPPPPPKDETEAGEEPAQQNGETEPAAEAAETPEKPEAEAESKEEETKESTLPQHKPEGDTESPSNGSTKSKEGDFNEVPL